MINGILLLLPQFDILWDALSGEEHLRLFASIKGLPPASINPVCHSNCRNALVGLFNSFKTEQMVSNFK